MSKVQGSSNNNNINNRLSRGYEELSIDNLSSTEEIKKYIEYIVECVMKNINSINNMHQYLLTAIYNAPITIDEYYRNLVDMEFNIIHKFLSQNATLNRNTKNDIIILSKLIGGL